MDKEILKLASDELLPCPFCGGTAVFYQDREGRLHIQHQPEGGVNCCARYDQYCDDVEQGRRWWNTRAT